MSSFDILIIGHLLGDFLFQTNTMATNKTKSWLALIFHAAVYTVCLVLVTAALWKPLTYVSIGVIFLSHIFLDKRILTEWWAAKIMKVESENAWLKIFIDQIFHILILMFVIYIENGVLMK